MKNVIKYMTAGLLGLATVSPTFADVKNPAISLEERSKIETVIQDYLMENPEIIMMAVQELKRRQTEAAMLPTINLYRDFLENEKGAPVVGNPDGDVTIVEFFDYRCGYCRRHYTEVIRLVKTDGNIRYIPRQFPVLDRAGAEPLSLMAAKAALAAHKQGKFAAFHDAMMTSGQSVTEDSIFAIAKNVGLDVTTLKMDMADKAITEKVRKELAIGKDIGFQGTPGYIIGNDIILGAEGYGRLKQAVDRARAELISQGR